MIGHNNRIVPLALQCDRCGRTSDRDDCDMNLDHWTLHCPACGEELDMFDHDDMKRRKERSWLEIDKKQERKSPVDGR